jgi:hypothetical protein
MWAGQTTDDDKSAQMLLGKNIYFFKSPEKAMMMQGFPDNKVNTIDRCKETSQKLWLLSN